MRKLLQPNLRISGALLIFLTLQVLEIHAQVTIVSDNNGNWNNPNTWNLSRVPLPGDVVAIRSQVVLNTSVNVNSILLDTQQSDLNIAGNVPISLNKLILEDGNCNIVNGQHSIDSILINGGDFSLGVAIINLDLFQLNAGNITSSSGGLNIENDFFIGANTSFDIGGTSLKVNGISQISGVFVDKLPDGINQFIGDVIVNSSGSFSVDMNASACDFGAGLWVDGSLSLMSNSIISFNGSGPQTLELNQPLTQIQGNVNVTSSQLNINGNSLINFSNPFSVANGTVISNNNAGITILNEALTGQGTWVNGPGATLNYRAEQAPLPNGTLDASSANNTFLYSRQGNQNVSPGNYTNLTFNGSGSKTLLAGTYVVSDNILLSENAVVSSNNSDDIDVSFQQALNIEANAAFSPDLSSSSVIRFRNGIINAGQCTPTGNGLALFESNTQSISNSGTCTLALATQVQVDLEVLAGSPVGFSKQLDLAASRTLSNSNPVLTIGGDLNGTGTFINAENTSLQYGGAVEPLSGGTFQVDAQNSRVVYNRNGNQIIRPGNYVHLELQNNGNKTVGDDLNVSGNFNLETNTVLDETASNLNFQFQGNMTLNGQINGQGGLYQLEGNSQQTLSGASQELALDRVLMNNAQGIILDNLNLRVNSSLQLQRGVIHTQANTLVLDNGINLDNLDPTSYVNGIITKIGNEDFVFPTGNASFEAPIEISNLSNADANTRFTAQYFNATPPNAENIGQGIGFVSNSEYWTLIKQGNGEAQVTLYWSNQNVSGIDDPDDLRVARLDSTQWNDGGAVATTKNNADGSITSDPQNTFQAFTFASQNGGNALGNTSQVPNQPNLLEVKPALGEARIVITWEHLPLDQKITTHYRIERRVGQNANFVTIADNLPRESTSYIDTDIKTFNTYFYRVFAVNAIDQSSASDTLGAVPTLITADRGEALKNAVKIYPMPIRDNLHFTINNNYIGMLELFVYNNVGERLKYHRLEKQFTEQEFEVFTEDLSNGAYIVVLSGPFGSSSWKIIK